jgi:hypothetical protein
MNGARSNGAGFRGAGRTVTMPRLCPLVEFPSCAKIGSVRATVLTVLSRTLAALSPDSRPDVVFVC